MLDMILVLRSCMESGQWVSKLKLYVPITQIFPCEATIIILNLIHVYIEGELIFHRLVTVINATR